MGFLPSTVFLVEIVLVNVISDYDDMRMYVEFHGCPVDFVAQFLDCKVPVGRATKGFLVMTFRAGFVEPSFKCTHRSPKSCCFGSMFLLFLLGNIDPGCDLAVWLHRGCIGFHPHPVFSRMNWWQDSFGKVAYTPEVQQLAPEK